MSQIRTYQTRLNLTVEQLSLFDHYASLFGRIERTLYADLMSGESAAKLKPSYCRQFGVTARQYNSIWFTLKGKIQSVREVMKDRLAETKQRIKKAKQVIKVLEKKQKSGQEVEFPLHQKKRRLASLCSVQEHLEADAQSGKVRLCFGSRKRFRGQFHLEANGYTSHAQWKQDWQEARSNQFFCIGSKDETSGNQSVTLQHLEENRFRFRLRLPDSLCTDRPVHTMFESQVTYGYETILAVLGHGGAISYRFLRDDKGWRLFISVDAPAVMPRSHAHLGAMGVDINSDHLAVAVVDRHGNVVAAKRIRLVTYGCSQEQSTARISEAVKSVMEMAVKANVPLVLEKLDFMRKKAQLEGNSPKHSRMLSSFAYGQSLQLLKARAYDAGIAVCEVNPAYTSVIGKYKFAQRYGLSSHQAAAVAIARRGMRLSERPNRQMSAQVAFPLPARNRGKHVWSFWRQVVLKAAAHGAHGQSVKTRSSLSESQLGITLSVAGGNPVCESSSALFG